jgi:hypothetical protein
MNTDPLRAPGTDDDYIAGLYIPADDRPPSGMVIVWIFASVLLLGLLALWLVVGAR